MKRWGLNVDRNGASRGLDVTATPGRHSCCASAVDSDESMAVLSSRCSLTAAATEHHDVKALKSGPDTAAAICYFNPIYSPGRQLRRTSTS